MQAIQTRYVPASNTRGSGVIAKCDRGSIRVAWDSELDTVGNHEAACLALRQRFAAEDAKQYGTPHNGNPWLRPMVSGGLPDGSWCHVFLPVEGGA